MTDTQGLTSNTSVGIFIVDQEDAPLIDIRSPAETISEEGIPIIFQVAVSDLQDAPEDLSVIFSSDLDGEMCARTPDDLGIAGCEYAPSVGTHQVLFEVTDSHGFVVTDTLECTVLPSSQVDNDFDGYTEEEGDCDDTVATTSPVGVEIHNGIDDDCDNLIDEETEAYDDDMDGFTELEGGL